MYKKYVAVQEVHYECGSVSSGPELVHSARNGPVTEHSST